MKEYNITYCEFAEVEDEKVLLEGIVEEAAKAKGMRPIRPFNFFVKDHLGRVLAGAKGTTLYGCLYVDLLWVSQDLRKKGLGSKLIARCEELGKERGCTFALIATMDWEAKPFYEKLGYTVEHIREGYEKNSKMYVLRKSL